MKNIRIGTMIVCAGIAALSSAFGADFKSASDCVAGRKVADKENKTGTVIGHGSVEHLCKVKMDKTGAVATYIFWMLHPAGGDSGTDDKLVPGAYECYQSGQYTFMTMYITGANTYRTDAGSGKFRLEPSQQIVFETGPLVKYTSKLIAGPGIALSTNGGSFYGTTCGLKK